MSVDSRLTSYRCAHPTRSVLHRLHVGGFTTDQLPAAPACRVPHSTDMKSVEAGWREEAHVARRLTVILPPRERKRRVAHLMPGDGEVASWWRGEVPDQLFDSSRTWSSCRDSRAGPRGLHVACLDSTTTIIVPRTIPPQPVARGSRGRDNGSRFCHAPQREAVAVGQFRAPCVGRVTETMIAGALFASSLCKVT